MKPSNVLFILSDEHQKHVAGCYGNSRAETPNLDKLAARGTLFSKAYTTCPICVPARASLATGKYVHEIGNWDNAFPYNGSERSWHHEVRDEGLTVDLIGKLHFRSQEDDNGFSKEHQPLHVVNGKGDPFGAIRWNPMIRRRRGGILNAGPGDSTYQQYDISNADKAIDWLDEHSNDDKPWALFLSFVCPHPPYKCPQELFDAIDPESLPTPPQWREEDWPRHPHYEWMRKFFDADIPFSENEIRNCIRAYYALAQFLDQQIGRVLERLESLGLDENTTIIYSTDHGECLGARGLFGKFTHYEESGGIPMIVVGPNVPAGKTCHTPVSLLDIHATVYDALDLKKETHRDSRSLIQLANQNEKHRYVFGEYHAINSKNGSFLLVDNRYKLIYHANEAPQFFDLVDDPGETKDLSADPAHQNLLRKFISKLRDICDPEAVDAEAKSAQRALIESYGGEEAVFSAGFFENSPVPGEKPKWKV